MRPVTVFTVDDHASFRSIARRLLEAAGFHVVGEAATGGEVADAVGLLLPDVVLLDVGLPDVDGFQVLRGLPTSVVVVLVSSRARTDYGRRVAASGARGFIAKAELSGEALRSLLRDGEGCSGCG